MRHKQDAKQLVIKIIYTYRKSGFNLLDSIAATVIHLQLVLDSFCGRNVLPKSIYQRAFNYMTDQNFENDIIEKLK